MYWFRDLPCWKYGIHYIEKEKTMESGNIPFGTLRGADEVARKLWNSASRTNKPRHQVQKRAFL